MLASFVAPLGGPFALRLVDVVVVPSDRLVGGSGSARCGSHVVVVFVGHLWPSPFPLSDVLLALWAVPRGLASLPIVGSDHSEVWGIGIHLGCLWTIVLAGDFG